MSYRELTKALEGARAWFQGVEQDPDAIISHHGVFYHIDLHGTPFTIYAAPFPDDRVRITYLREERCHLDSVSDEERGGLVEPTNEVFGPESTSWLCGVSGRLGVSLVYPLDVLPSVRQAFRGRDCGVEGHRLLCGCEEYQRRKNLAQKPPGWK